MTGQQRRTVVVGVDGSDESLRAVRFGVAEAARLRVPLQLVNAFDQATDRVVGQPTLGTRDRDISLAQAHRAVAAAATIAESEAPGVEIEQHVVVGFPVEVLVDESRRAHLLVVGNRGLSRIEGMLVGSVSVALAAHADCPVVIVRGPEHDDDPDRIRPVVLGVDGSPAGEAAVDFAFDEAAYRRAPLVAVHAWTPDPFASGSAGTDDTEVLAREVLAERLAGWGQKHPDVTVVRTVLQDRPLPALVRESARAQLVVVGSRGHGVLAGAVLGSVGHALVHRAPCPVAIVPRGPAQ